MECPDKLFDKTRNIFRKRNIKIIMAGLIADLYSIWELSSFPFLKSVSLILEYNLDFKKVIINRKKKTLEYEGMPMCESIPNRVSMEPKEEKLRLTPLELMNRRDVRKNKRKNMGKRTVFKINRALKFVFCILESAPGLIKL